MWDRSADKAEELGFILSSFGVHRAISHSCSDINVLLDLSQCSWGLSGVRSSKSRLLTCLMGNMELLCTQCRGIEPHLPASGKSYGFTPVAAITWGIFSSFGWDEPSKLLFVQLGEESCLVMRDARGIYSRLGRAIRTLLVVRQETKFLFLVSTVILVFLSIFNRSQASSSFEALNSACLSRVKGI